MKVKYKFRAYPTREQEQQLIRTFGCCRFVYNWALRLRTDSFQAGETINYLASSAALTKLKNLPEYSWLREVSCVPTQQALRHLQTAYKNFFEKRNGYPTFKKKFGKQAAEYTASAFKWDASNRTLYLAKIGKMKLRLSRMFDSIPSTVTITKDATGRYFATFTLDEQIAPLPKTGVPIGIDLGISRLATLSDGTHIPNTKQLNHYTKKLRYAQRQLSKKVKGSNRRNKARVRVAKIHAKILDTRKDYLNKMTINLVRKFDVICIEDLHVRGMVRNHCLARSLSDASLTTIRSMLEYKCLWYGKELKVVDRFFPSSKRCSCCGYVLEKLPLSVRNWTCPDCSTVHDRDENAAKNILTAGHAVTARGGSVRPIRATARKGTTQRSVNQLGKVKQQC